MVVVDTSVWIDYFNGVECCQADRLDILLRGRSVLVGDIVLAEVLQGFRDEQHFELAKEMLDELPFQVFGSYEVAVEAANSFRYLRRKGITIRKTVDMIIGAYCVLSGAYLLHNDRDFDAMAKHLSLECVTR